MNRLKELKRENKLLRKQLDKIYLPNLFNSL